MKHLKVCFIGCGDHAKRFILPALAGAEHVTLSAICARTREHAEAAAARTGARRACTDYREMIETENPDAVFVVGPPKLQFETGMFCLAHRIPFFSEKPCGSSLEEAEQLVSAAEENSPASAAARWQEGKNRADVSLPYVCLRLSSCVSPSPRVSGLHGPAGRHCKRNP